MSIHKETKGKNKGLYYFRTRVKNEDDKVKNIQRGYWSNKKIALQEELKFLDSLNEEKYNIHDFTFEQMANKFLEFYKVRRKIGSYTKKCEILKNHILPFFQNKKIAAITSLMTNAWQETIYNKKFSYDHNCQIYIVLNMVFEHAVTYYALKTNPLAKTPKFEQHGEEAKVLDYWDADSFSKFISVIENDAHKLLYYTSFFTKARPGEVQALRINDINIKDLHKASIRIDQNYVAKYYHGEPITEDPKTSTGKRTVSIPYNLALLFKKHLEQLKIQFDNVTADFFIFTLDGVKPYSQTSITRWKNKYEKKAGLEHIRLYDLRSSGLMESVEQGMDIQSAAKRMGHKDSNTTLKYYMRSKKDAENKAVDGFNKLIKIEEN